jgi:hypothetical protein
MENQEPQNQYQSQPHTQNETAPSLSFGEWLVTLLIMIVPVLNFVMLIVWASDRNTNPNKANWARASLVIIGIQLVIAMFFIGTIIGSLSTLMNNFNTSGMW